MLIVLSCLKILFSSIVQLIMLFLTHAVFDIYPYVSVAKHSFA